MEMSWFALAPTIVIAVIIAAKTLVRPREGVRIDNGKGESNAPDVGGPFPTFSSGAREIWNARQRVWPITYNDLNARAQRGIKVAMVLVVIAILLAGDHAPEDWRFLAVLGSTILFIPIGGVMSVTHTLALRVMPYRGPIVSIALGAALGVVLTLIFGTSDLPKYALVWAGAIYGLIIGIIDFSAPPEKVRKKKV